MQISSNSLKNLTSEFGFKKGHTAWNKGLKGMKPYLDISGLLGVSNEERATHGFKKGCIPWNKGKEYPQIQGSNHWKWKANRDELIRKDQRNDPLYKRWMTEVKRRDKVCMKSDSHCFGYKVAHHIKSWADYPELRYDVDNGITLCRLHHYLEHGYKIEALIEKSEY